MSRGGERGPGTGCWVAAPPEGGVPPNEETPCPGASPARGRRGSAWYSTRTAGWGRGEEGGTVLWPGCIREGRRKNSRKPHCDISGHVQIKTHYITTPLGIYTFIYTYILHLHAAFHVQIKTHHIYIHFFHLYVGLHLNTTFTCQISCLNKTYYTYKHLSIYT